MNIKKGWQDVRANPLDQRSWNILACAYAEMALPWHANYARMQEQLCVKVHGGQLAPQRIVHDAICWAPGVQQLSLSTPWDGLRDVLQLLEAQIHAEPSDWLSWVYFARCLEMIQLGDIKNSHSPQLHHAIRQALACEPIAGETGHLMAQWRLRAGQPLLAEAALRAVLLQAPQRYSSWLLLAETQMQLGFETEARLSFERAGESRNPEFLSLLAEKLFIFNFGYESQTIRDVVTKLKPYDPKAWLSLAEIQAKLWQVEAAEKSLKQVLALEPNNMLALRFREDLAAIGNSRAQFDLELMYFDSKGLRDNGKGSTRLLMQSLYQSHLEADQVALLHQRVGNALAEQAKKTFKSNLMSIDPLPWDGQRRLRVGYVTGDLHRQHPVNIFMLPILQHHNHEMFEIFVYHTGTLVDEYTRQARSYVDSWCEAGHLDDLMLRQIIINDHIDVLIDLAGHTATHRLAVFASRAAPVQISYLGYPHSTGLPFMDWMITDAIVAPPEHEYLFTERLARVSGSVFCWAPVDNYPLPKDHGLIKKDAVVFASFNNLLKVDDATIEVWAKILNKCPESKLLLKSATLADSVIQQQTLERFARVGVAADQLVLRGPSELSIMMQEYLEVDIALDPFPYNGGTTSLQALWMGCPLIALEGNNFVSRMGASFLTQLNRTEWIAKDVTDYVNKAVDMANYMRKEPWSRNTLRKDMQSSRLCDIESHTHEIEVIYRSAFENWLITAS